MPMVHRALMLAALFAVAPGATAGQGLPLLRISMTVADATGAAKFVPRHALLISDDPPTRAPRWVVTGPDGNVDVRLSPGSYLVESDKPLVFDGKSYEWRQTVEVRVDGQVTLALTAANAAVGTATASDASASTSEPTENDPSFLLSEWRDSVVAVWTPTSRASGFLADASGLIVTSHRAIGRASAVEVQFSPSVKAAARVLVNDAAKDVAVLWVDATVAASVRPVPLACEDAAPPLADGQRVVAVGAPLRGQKDVAVGEVFRLEPLASGADFRLSTGSAGGPVFATGGRLLGLSSVADDADARRSDARIVPVGDACLAVRSAQDAMQAAPRPEASRRPVEPPQPFPADALDAAVQRRAGNPRPPPMSSSDFDIAFLTPVDVHGAQRSAQPPSTRSGQGRTGGSGARPPTPVSPTDFGEWSDYFTDVPPVLVVRVTPKLAESFWTTIARGAAYTQGVALPPIKRFKPGFSRLRAYCGEVEVTPIHPFTLEQRLSETDAIREGLYVFEPAAFGPHCKSVKLALYSEKEPDKPDTRTVDAQIVDRIWIDFAAYRALGAAADAGRP
jgi:hypothetical protein